MRLRLSPRGQWHETLQDLKDEMVRIRMNRAIAEREDGTFTEIGPAWGRSEEEVASWPGLEAWRFEQPLCGKQLQALLLDAANDLLDLRDFLTRLLPGWSAEEKAEALRIVQGLQEGVRELQDECFSPDAVEELNLYKVFENLLRAEK